MFIVNASSRLATFLRHFSRRGITRIVSRLRTRPFRVVTILVRLDRLLRDNTTIPNRCNIERTVRHLTPNRANRFTSRLNDSLLTTPNTLVRGKRTISRNAIYGTDSRNNDVQHRFRTLRSNRLLRTRHRDLQLGALGIGTLTSTRGNNERLVRLYNNWGGSRVDEQFLRHLR